MFRRWRVRHSYPRQIVELVTRLEPIYGAAMLSRLVDIPTSVIYRWRTNRYTSVVLSEDSAVNAEMLDTLVAHCKGFGFRVAAYAPATSGRSHTSIQTLRRTPTVGISLGNTFDDTSTHTPIPSLQICRDSANGQRSQHDALVSANPSGLSVRPRATGRHVFDARSERPMCGVRNRMEAARQTIDTQYFLDLSCHTFAETAQMSRFHFIRTFGDMFGITPHQYLMRARVKAAKWLLLVSSEPIEVIAVGVGFQSGPNLNRAFKRIEGMSVSQYCKTLKKGKVGKIPMMSIPPAMVASLRASPEHQGP